MKNLPLLALPVLLAGALSLAGCPPPPNHLEGSISDSHDLSFDRTQLRHLTDQSVFELSYFKDLGGGGVDVVAKVVVQEPEGGAKANEDINLDPATDVVQRVTAANDGFPSGFREGVFRFFSAPKAGETSSGEFAVTFDNGKTLNGGFEVELEECSFDACE